MLAFAIHIHTVPLYISGIEHSTIPPLRTVLDGLGLNTTKGKQTHHDR